MHNGLLWQLIGSLLVSLIVGLIAGSFCIPILHRLKFGQSIREEGPASHQKKTGTPTMGGVIFLFGLFFAILFFAHFNLDTWLIFLATIAFGFIGFCDDYLKVIKKQNLGLRAKQKLIMQIFMSVLFTILYLHLRGGETYLNIPFASFSLNIGWLYFPFAVFWFTGFSNAVNLTDGLDGLATSVTLVVLLTFSIISFINGYNGVLIFCVSLIGSCLAFLWFNHYPAKVFMGDTGSLALGGAVTAISICTHCEIAMILIGGIYVAETLSVIIQVTYFKSTGKRIFLMSPLHHHYELKGYREVQVVTRFTIVSVLLALIGLLGVYI